MIHSHHLCFCYRFLLIMKTHGILIHPAEPGKLASFLQKAPTPCVFLVGKSSSDPKMAGERRWVCFPIGLLERDKVPQPLRRYLGWRAFLQMNPGFQMVFSLIAQTLPKEKSKVPWPTIGCMKLEMHATLSHLLKKSKDLPHKNIEKTPNKTSFFTLRENNFSLHFCRVPPTKLPDIEPPYGHAPQ